MATRKQQQQAAATQAVIYPRDGLLGAEIGGQRFDVPASVGNKAAWIESQYRERVARQTADAERESRDMAVLADRKQQVIQQEAEALLLAREVDGELSAVKRELADIQATVAAPDQQKIVEASQAAAALMGRVVDSSRDLNALADKVEALHQQTAQMLELAQSERQTTLDLIANQIELLNGIQKSNGDLINDYRARYTEAAQEAINLSEQIGLNWEVVQNAANINETAIAQATAASKELLKSQHQEFLAALSVALGAMGVTQEDLDRELVRLNTMGADFKSPLVSSDYLAQMVSVTNKHRDAREDAERRTNAAASTQSLYQFGPNANADKRPGFKRDK